MLNIPFSFFPPHALVLKNSSQLLGLRLITALLTASLTPTQCWANLFWSTLILNKYSFGSIKTVCDSGFTAFSNFRNPRTLGKLIVLVHSS